MKCEVCGQEVKFEGKTTQHYVGLEREKVWEQMRRACCHLKLYKNVIAYDCVNNDIDTLVCQIADCPLMKELK